MGVTINILVRTVCPFTAVLSSVLSLLGGMNALRLRQPAKLRIAVKALRIESIKFGAVGDLCVGRGLGRPTALHRVRTTDTVTTTLCTF